MTIRAKSPAYLSPEACLFIANLPSRFLNEELSYQITNSLKGFGTVVSVKTARDNEGRPYSFVQFQRTESAKEVLKRKLTISIGGRKVRIEKAKCLRKLQISVSILSTQSVLEVKKLLSKYSEVHDIIHVEMDGYAPEMNETGTRPKFSFTIKLKDDLNADEAFQELSEQNPDWHLEWISSVPRPRQFPFTMQEYRNNPSENLNYHYPGMSQRSMVDSFETLTLQDDYDHSTRSTPLCTPRTEPETVEVRSSDSPTEEFEIFVGRLNSQKVDHDLLFRRFSEYGEVLNVHLINKRRTTGIPQDAFAFITYRKHEEACRAIEKENGKAWMGHAIKVAHSVPRCTMAASQKNFHYPPFYGYHHPIPPPVLSSLPASMKQQYEYYAALYSDMNPFVSGPYIQHGQKYGGPIPYFPYHPMFPPFGFLPSYPPVPPSTSSYQNGPTYKSENQRSASEPFAN